MAPVLTRRHCLVLAVGAALLPAVAGAQGTREVVEMALGAPDAPVTVVEYASFTCPHCASFHQEVLPQLKESFIDPGKVRLVYREVYFDRPGLWASMIARCAGPDRYFGVADLLYRRQAEWSQAGDDAAVIDALFSIGRQAGLTDAEMTACTQDQAFAQALVADYQANAAADGIDSTPSFVVDGEKHGNMGFEAFSELLNDRLG